MSEYVRKLKDSSNVSIVACHFVATYSLKARLRELFVNREERANDRERLIKTVRWDVIDDAASQRADHSPHK
jgi:hypothetical protein